MASCRAAVAVLVSAACVLLGFPAPAAVALAQNTGTIEGHVYAADTNGPIRIGNVLLKLDRAGDQRCAEEVRRGCAV